MFKHEINGQGNHRIVQVDPKGKTLNEGEWAGYHNIASLNAGGKSTIAVTQYYLGTALEPEKIYAVELL